MEGNHKAGISLFLIAKLKDKRHTSAHSYQSEGGMSAFSKNRRDSVPRKLPTDIIENY